MKQLLLCMTFSQLLVAQGPVSSKKDEDGNILSKVAGTVAENVVTSRDVKISHILELAFKRKPFEDFNDKSSKFPIYVSEALLERMLYQEALALKSEEPAALDKQKLEQDLNNLLKENEASNFWKKLEVTLEERRLAIEKKLKSKKLLQFRTQSSQVTATDYDALNYYQQNKAKFGNSPFEKHKEAIKSYLEQQKSENRLKDWLTILQKKYNVKHLSAKSS